MTAVVSQLALSQEQDGALRMEVRRLQEQVASLSSEQEDLLVMLADQVRRGAVLVKKEGLSERILSIFFSSLKEATSFLPLGIAVGLDPAFATLNYFLRILRNFTSNFGRPLRFCTSHKERSDLP
jgi:hypothetical protein